MKIPAYTTMKTLAETVRHYPKRYLLISGLSMLIGGADDVSVDHELTIARLCAKDYQEANRLDRSKYLLLQEAKLTEELAQCAKLAKDGLTIAAEGFWEQAQKTAAYIGGYRAGYHHATAEQEA